MKLLHEYEQLFSPFIVILPHPTTHNLALTLGMRNAVRYTAGKASVSVPLEAQQRAKSLSFALKKVREISAKNI